MDETRSIEDLLSKDDFITFLNSMDPKSKSYLQLKRKYQHESLAFKKTQLFSSIKKFILTMFAITLAYFAYNYEFNYILLNDHCLVATPEFVQDVFRPSIADCSFCKINNIPDTHNLTEDEFYKNYAYTGFPLLVTDGMKNWKTELFNYENLKTLYKPHLDQIEKEEEKGNCQFLHWRTEDVTSLKELFSLSKERASFAAGSSPWYVGWSNCIANITEILREHYSIPYFFGRSERPKNDWIFIGSPNYIGAPLHLDHVDYASWQAQVKGQKQWELVPPPECWTECPIHKHTIVVKPGNVFLFDSNRWFHATRILKGDYSLTIGSEYQ